jgi:hypothetical protein
MIINTFSYLWKLTAIDAITELAGSGYRIFEVPVSSPHCWPDEMSPTMRSDTKKQLQDHAASVRSLNAGGFDINLASPGANMRRKSIEHIKRCDRSCLRMGRGRRRNITGNETSNDFSTDFANA